LTQKFKLTHYFRALCLDFALPADSITIMDYTLIISELRAATLFDLFRLRAALSQQLEEPERIEQVRSRLRPGMLISYFDEAQNRLIEASVRELHRTRLLVENRDNKARWSIPFGAVNIDGVETDIRAVAEQRAIDRSRLKVGDAVGFRDRQNQDKYGRVVGLNQKTATILTSDHQKWRVAYQFLFPVIESNE
jgi:hypothetical protein